MLIMLRGLLFSVFLSNFELISIRKMKSCCLWVTLLHIMSNIPKLGTFRVTQTNSTSLFAFGVGISTAAPEMSHAYHSLDSRVKNFADTLENFQSNSVKKKKLSIPQVYRLVHFRRSSFLEAIKCTTICFLIIFFFHVISVSIEFKMRLDGADGSFGGKRRVSYVSHHCCMCNQFAIRFFYSKRGSPAKVVILPASARRLVIIQNYRIKY